VGGRRNCAARPARCLRRKARLECQKAPLEQLIRERRQAEAEA
jgi:hypothetical protein